MRELSQGKLRYTPAKINQTHGGTLILADEFKDETSEFANDGTELVERNGIADLYYWAIQLLHLAEMRPDGRTENRNYRAGGGQLLQAVRKMFADKSLQDNRYDFITDENWSIYFNSNANLRRAITNLQTLVERRTDVVTQEFNAAIVWHAVRQRHYLVSLLERHDGVNRPRSIFIEKSALGYNIKTDAVGDLRMSIFTNFSVPNDTPPDNRFVIIRGWVNLLDRNFFTGSRLYYWEIENNNINGWIPQNCHVIQNADWGYVNISTRLSSTPAGTGGLGIDDFRPSKNIRGFIPPDTNGNLPQMALSNTAARFDMSSENLQQAGITIEPISVVGRV